MIKAWSMSRLDVYESCPYRAYLQYVERVPTLPLVAPEGLGEHPLTRGLRVHEAAEKYVTEDVLLIDELQNFTTAFDLQRTAYRTRPGLCVVEEEWAVNDDWKATGWFSDDAWCRLKLDWGQVRDDEMDIVDYKTGKKYPPKHIQQGQLYALIGSIRFPQVKKVNVQFWYLDSGDTLEQTYNNIQVQLFQDDFDRRARIMTSATEFPPRSSAYTCRFCPYGEGKDGNSHCQYRYSFQN